MRIDNRQRTGVGKARKEFAAGGLNPARATVRSISTLESLKGRLLAEQLAKVQDTELRRRLRWAAEDSASLAWATPIPLLALPELLNERAREAFHQFERQQILKASRRAPVELAA